MMVIMIIMTMMKMMDVCLANLPQVWRYQCNGETGQADRRSDGNAPVRCARCAGGAAGGRPGDPRRWRQGGGGEWDEQLFPFS